MLNNITHILTYEQQQKAVERIQALMARGMSSSKAIIQVARELRANHTGEMVFTHCNHKEDADTSL
ncbi:YoaH family protein [Candidatus Hoaglandella endobia]|uniref:Uncharacterized protein n=1 Tax=Candidatus Hoaglandella endobia TaxID=1778263 RepID=A0A143WUG4_9ENTR|nr:YoaH family protein [Candidatus Hoaglandella endobia]CUX97400.1 hypothetical protein TPER_HE00491 [Candidatus Hoaglandella endobia]